MLYTLIDDDDLVAGCHERDSVVFLLARRRRQCRVSKIEIFLSVALPFFVGHILSCSDMFWPMPNEMNTTKDESVLNAKLVVSNEKKSRNRKVDEKEKKCIFNFALKYARNRYRSATATASSFENVVDDDDISAEEIGCQVQWRQCSDHTESQL